MTRSYAHSFERKHKRKSYEYKLLRQNLQKYKMAVAKMRSKSNYDENYMRFLNMKIQRIESALYADDSL
jgi:hypothetical protein